MAALPDEPVNPYRLVDSWIDARLDSSRIVPGQVIGLKWMLSTYNPVRFGDFTLRVLLEGNVLYTSAVISGYVYGTWQHISVLRPSDSGLAGALYAPGSKALELQISSSVPGATPWSTNVQLEVVREEPGDSWWSWDQPVGSAGFIDWKASYSLGGSLINGSQWTMMGGSLTVRQGDPTDAKGEQRSASVDQLMAKASVGVAFPPPIAQEWTWLMPGAWVTIGPTEKRFTYTLDVALRDQFITGYNFTPTELQVLVSVPKHKLALAATALGTSIDAAVFLALAAGCAAGIITSPLAPGFFAAATSFEAAALAAGKMALDPPRPVRDFEEPAPMPEYDWSLPDALGALPSLRRSFGALARMLAAMELMGQVEGRLLTARIFDDKPAMQLQEDSLVKAQEQIKESRVTLEEHASAAAREFDDVVPLQERLKVRDQRTQLLTRRLPKGVETEIPTDYLVSHTAGGLRSPGRWFQLAANGAIAAGGLLESTLQVPSVHSAEIETAQESDVRHGVEF